MTPALNRISMAGEPDVFLVEDRASGLRAFVAFGGIGSVRSFGGIRRLRYDPDDAALVDARRLARQMERKLRAARTGCGGAKTVVVDHDGLDRRDAYAALGRAVAALDGRYVCGPDVGTTEDDLDVMRTWTEHVNHADNDPGRSTARGVVQSCLVALRRIGVAGFEGAHIVVEGLGAVGSRVARALDAAGARLEVHDLDTARVRDVIDATSATSLSAGVPAVERECDLFVPCALGDVVTSASVSRIGARAICGSANDQLVEDRIAHELHRRGVLWAPDFLVNAGAVIEGVIAHGHRRADVAGEIDAALDAMGSRLEDVFRDAAQRDVSPIVPALELAGEEC